MSKDRSSEADEPELIADRQLKAKREAENTLRQFDYSMIELSKWLLDVNYRLRPSTILKLNRYALEGLSGYAGVFRPAGVKITGSEHAPVGAAEVPGAVEEFCDYIHDNWSSRTALHLAAYALWRLNWIHPFVDGNGRTARAVSYLILCAKLGGRLPGKVTIPEQIALNKKPYYAALEDADTHFSISKNINVSAMEEMLNAQLASQLVSVHEDASGVSHERSAIAEVANRKSNSGETPKNISPGRNWVLKLIEDHPVLAGGIFLLIATLIGAVLSGK